MGLAIGITWVKLPKIINNPSYSFGTMSFYWLHHTYVISRACNAYLKQKFLACYWLYITPAKLMKHECLRDNSFWIYHWLVKLSQYRFKYHYLSPWWLIANRNSKEQAFLNEIWMKTPNFWMKMYLKLSSMKWWPFIQVSMCWDHDIPALLRW